GLGDAYSTVVKQSRVGKLAEVRQKVQEALAAADNPQYPKDPAATTLPALESRLVRDMILDGKPRIDGRDLKTVRPIRIEVGALPRTHGSAIFTRGETQAL